MTETNTLKQTALQQLLSLLPERVGSFGGTEYPLPVKSTFLGNNSIDIPELRKQLEDMQNADIKELLEPLLLASELYEASCGDRQDFFITDEALQGHVFMGSKWRAGWSLVLGEYKEELLFDRLKEYGFIVFTDCPDVADTVYIGGRQTSPIYFLQMMVRYGLIWGGISPGDDHEMGHYLEKDMPGLVIIRNDLEPLKYLIALGLMKLGAPAVVPGSFPFPYGNRVTADNVDEVMERGVHFQNLRLRYYKDEVITLPEYCNPAYVNEKINAVTKFGGTSLSFFCVRPSQKDRGIPESAEAHDILPSADLGIDIEIRHNAFTDDMAFIVEQAALKSVNYLHGVKAFNKDGIFHLEAGESAELKVDKLREAIYWGIRLNFPKLEEISVNIISDRAILEEESEKIKEYKAERLNKINSITEENTDEFCACTECRPFSLVHTCIIAPDRLPMCASRTYSSVKGGALFGSDTVPYRRRSDEVLPIRQLFKKGRVLDPIKGEYEGCNAIYDEMTGGKLKRVFLHSVRDYPITSCGCFQNLAFWIEEVNGIGIMSRGSKAVTPDGSTWSALANKAGGKQTPGICGVSLNYIKSSKFLKGDGGLKNVVWVDSELYHRISGLFAEDQKVATEKDVRNVEELMAFIGSK